MYSIELYEMVYWFESEDTFKQALNSNSSRAHRIWYSDVAFNNATREVVKCRYDLKEIIDSWMYRRSHQDNMNKMEQNVFSKGETQ
jgi:hypothetical protein